MISRLKFAFLKGWYRVRKIVLGRHSVGIQYKTENGLILAPIDDVAIGKHLGFNRGWNVEEVSKLSALIGSEDAVYFLGAHIGTLVVPIARKCKQVIAYEANPDNFTFLNWNIVINQLQTVRTFNLAVGDCKREVNFYKNKINSGGSKIKPIKENFLYSYDDPEKITVPMIDLDSHILSENMSYPDCIIMDIEGAEFFALKGMQESLQHCRILYMEYVPHHLSHVSSTSNNELMDLIIHNFTIVKFNTLKREIDISTSTHELMDLLDDLYNKGKSDDLLFLK